MSSKKTEADARKILELLRDPALSPKDLAERVGASPEAVDEARVLVDELPTAEVDALLALPPTLARAALLAAAAGGRHDVIAEAFGSADKEIQKEARRIAHHLRLRGIDVGAPPKPAPPPPPAEPAPVELPTLLSSIDSHGERVAFWTRVLPGRGIEVAQIVLSDQRGVVSLSLAELSRRRFRELCEELVHEGPVTIVEASRDAVRRAIDRARMLGRERGELPSSFAPWAAQVFGPVPAAAPPPLGPEGDGRPPADDAGRAGLARESGVLFDQPEIDRWAPDEEAMQRVALRVDEAAASPLYLSGAAGEQQREEAVAAAVDRAALAYFEEPAIRVRWAGRLSETAYLFERSGRLEAARLAAATAFRLAGGAAVTEVPFCRELFARLFRPEPTAAEAEPEGPKTTESGLLVLPGSDRPRH
jgi:hypothetical protein